LAGGGTGGHIFPNIAIAKGLNKKFGRKKKELKTLYVGSLFGPERAIAKQQKVPFVGIFAGKLRRYISIKTILDLIFIPIGIFQSFFIVLFFRPQVIFSKGGYVSFPVVIAAWILRKKIVAHESDSIPGLTNRRIAKMANKICITYETSANFFPKGKSVLTGIPLRESLAFNDPDKGLKFLGFNKKLPLVLVIGGSQGAQQINELVAAALPQLLEVCQIVHLCGNGKKTEHKLPKKLQPRYQQYEFLTSELKDIYAAATLVVSRSGANTLAEIQYFQKPSVLIPLESAANNHQHENAFYCTEKGLSDVFTETEITPEIFAYRITSLLEDKKRLKEMEQKLKANKLPDATTEIVNLLIDESRNKR